MQNERIRKAIDYLRAYLHSLPDSGLTRKHLTDLDHFARAVKRTIVMGASEDEQVAEARALLGKSMEKLLTQESSFAREILNNLALKYEEIDRHVRGIPPRFIPEDNQPYFPDEQIKSFIEDSRDYTPVT